MRKIYYVSVSSGTVEDQQTLADQQNYSYEFIVEADDEEIGELHRLLSEYAADMQKTHNRAFIPYKSADHDAATKSFNDRMLSLYTLLYRLGTAETRRHIEKMNVMDKLQHPDYHDPGYPK